MNKGERSDARNYRPIALLPNVSKVFEYFAHKQLLDYCLKAGAFLTSSLGFCRKGQPLGSSFLSRTTLIDSALDERKEVHACFLDISKALDRVDHGLLLCTLSDVGLKDKEFDWFVYYLKNRKISTCVDGYRSQETPISSGVPQGSVLGPLLFLLFLKDLPTAVSGSSALFADDTLVYDRCAVTSMSPCCRLQQDLDSFDQWAAASATTFNAMKSSVMLFSGKRGRKSHLCTSSALVPGQATVEQLERENTAPWCQIDNGAVLDSHIDNLIRRVSYKVHMLKRLAYRCGSNTFVRHLYISLVRLVLEYAGPAWDSYTLEDCLRVEILQLSVARAILRASRCTKSDVSVLAKIGWPTLA